MAKNDWFRVDKEGLAKLLERRGGKVFILFELIQNAWDQLVTSVVVTLRLQDGSPTAIIEVEDDDPNGFANLDHAFTLFADSIKKGNPEQRGRFNLGEKLVLACCINAKIETTSGTVFFQADGERTSSKAKGKVRERGSKFSATIRMTRSEYESVCLEVRKLIPPAHINTTFNGEELKKRSVVAEFEDILPTEIADDAGALRRTNRKTKVRIYAPLPGETASIYEMGIPIVETGDKYHVDVQQKVPLNMERDNVPPSYLRVLRTMVLNQTFNQLSAEEAASKWVNDATSDPDCHDNAIKTVITKRFGEKVVIYDASNPEANRKAQAEGYYVLGGGSLNSEQWSNIKRSGAALPSGQVTPVEKPYSADGTPLKTIPASKWSPQQTLVAEYAEMLGRELMNVNVHVSICNEFNLHASMTYGKGGDLVMNLARLGKGFFELFPSNREAVNAILLHEFAHEYCSDHLSDDYHKAICRLGSRLCELALTSPSLFAKFGVTEHAAH